MEYQTTKSGITCGLDFGTSNSVISLTDRQTRQEIFSYSVSSVLYFPESNDLVCYVGKEAQEKYVQEEMKGRLLKSVKTLLKQDDFLFTWINGKKVTPEQMAAYIIMHLKKQAETFLGTSITEVVLGRPAVFSTDEKKERTAVTRLLQAAHSAGFEKVTLEMEPIAAAYSYEQTLAGPENILVADFGGGTSDFTVIRLDPQKHHTQDRSNDILSYGGVYVGGDLFDSQIMWHKVTPELGRGTEYRCYGKSIEIPAVLYRELMRWERSFLLKESKARRDMNKYYVFSDQNKKIEQVCRLVDGNYVFSLFKAIEKAKMALSQSTHTSIEFHEAEINLSIPFLRTEFPQIITSQLTDIRNCIKQVIDSCQMDIAQIDTVYLTGGSSLAHPVQALMNDLFPNKHIHQGNIFHSVSYGLSLA